MLLSCFIYFSKAFERVHRNKLFDKLRTVYKRTRFRSTDVHALNDKSAVKIENKITQKFPCHNGVGQGCMLSHTLSNIYLSDLPEMLNRGSEWGGGGDVVHMSVVG